jgi:para-nitrobenzyl esterase
MASGVDRRQAIGAIAGAALMSGATHGATTDPVAETRLGKVRGAVQDGVIAFKGIRYAVADRFMPPRPPEPWSGIRDAVAFGAIAPQTNPHPPAGPPPVILAQLPRPQGAPPPPRPVESEDCLFLNVWTSGLADGRKRPVMVWLHGGFFSSGSGASGDGHALARRGDVVVVSLNHRLNTFGYTHLADAGGSDFAHAGNVGMLDIVAALEWVRDNIDRFGGDPKRVMVFGESGGGMKTSFLMASPRARGLVHRAGVQSGPGLAFMERDRAAQATAALMTELGLKANDVAALRALPMAQLLAGYHAVAAKLRPERFIDLSCFAPVLDPQLLPRQPYSPAAVAQAAAIPLLIGWNGQEMSFFMGNDPDGFTLDEAGARARFARFLGAKSDEAYALYARLYPEASPSRRYIQAFSDYSIMLPTLAQADRHAAAGGRAHVYRFDKASPALGGKLGALHTSEAAYVFDQTDAQAALTGGGADARALARTMSEAWVHFASTAEPAASGLPAWPRHRAGDRAVMLLDDKCRVVHNPERDVQALMAPLLKL